MTFETLPQFRPRLARTLPMLTLAAILAGCATTAPAPLTLDPARERGQALAERRCSGCHAVGLDETPASSGPRFRDLARRYNPLSLQARFKEISAHGSGEMPPLEISASEAEDLLAYFSSLPDR